MTIVRRRKKQPTADEMRARIESQRQTIELMAEEIRVLNSHLRIKDAAIGKKATPGPLYGVKSHAWAALAVAITAEARLAAQATA